MIVLLEEPETWSLMMLVTAVAMDNADISEEGKTAIRKWRTARGESSPELSALTEELNRATNSHLDAKFFRRVKNKGWYETVRK